MKFKNTFTNTEYKILCVIIHSGSAIGGHYYCYRFIWNDDNTNFNIYN